MNCPEGKIFNPSTGRCVKIDGKKGREILARQGETQVRTHQNNDDKILNPETGRYVKRVGRIGKRLVLASESRENSNISVPSYRG